MTNAKISRGKLKLILVLAILATLALLNSVFAAVPTGPSLEYMSNETSNASGVPTLEGNNDSQGGWIITLRLTARQSNPHYKAYVGNVTGAYVLEDASNYSIYEWNVSVIAGEVYATRTSGTIDWANVECANVTHMNQEMTEMHHNSTNTPDDSMNETFDDDGNDHWDFWAGSSHIIADTCNYSVNTYVNDTPQTSTEWFDEVLLYDGSANLVYVTKIENNIDSYKNDAANTTYDFQMLVAENGSPATSQTDYYFYVELS